MKYRIFIISHSKGYDIELHNLEVEAIQTNLCFVKLFENEAETIAESLANILAMVIGKDSCDIVHASKTK